ncbi:putative non-specific serine/threonine protein kinase [Rosa chinensis]|uniref:Putative non-specific serine/threonine protein kinase n=1 Tax=Rosa chinensis TaxID=74649 RepID=A0A2P6PRB0_ROSCH|nr:putative non-specific serine/threonine protein kinase [Rosa chinensis]
MVLQSGMYSFRLIKNENLTMLWNDSIVYWNQGLNSSVTNNTPNLTSPTLGVQPIGILTISDPKLATVAIVSHSNDYAEAGDILRFFKLEGDENVRIYSSTKGSGSTIESWAVVTDQC